MELGLARIDSPLHFLRFSPIVLCHTLCFMARGGIIIARRHTPLRSPRNTTSGHCTATMKVTLVLFAMICLSTVLPVHTMHLRAQPGYSGGPGNNQPRMNPHAETYCGLPKYRDACRAQCLNLVDAITVHGLKKTDSKRLGLQHQVCALAAPTICFWPVIMCLNFGIYPPGLSDLWTNRSLWPGFEALV